MIRNKTGPKVIDLDGPEGNAWFLLGYAKTAASELDLDYESIREEMMAGDYEHLLEVFDKHFGAFYILERSDLE